MTHAASSGTPSSPPPGIVRQLDKIERDSRLDAVSARLAPLADRLLADPGRRHLLKGHWLGHAVHPPMTDVPIGAWTSASVLDLIGGRRSRTAARRLVAVGLVAALPTIVTGLAEWGDTRNGERRIGVVHAMSNSVALAMYAASYLARRKDHHKRGALLSLAGAGAAGVGGYLGGHLIVVNKVGSRPDAFQENPQPLG